MTPSAQTRISVGSPLHRPICPEGRAAVDIECGRPCPERTRPFVLAATILASAMAFIDATIVTIALPSLQADLDANFLALQWVVNAYALSLGGLILVGGGAGDRFGRRRVFVIGIAIFALASLACAVAPTVEALIVARGIQGIGAALLVPQSLAIIAAAFPKAVRGRAIGIWAGASALTTALGPPLGGFLIDALDWRSVFWINLPLSAAAIWLALRYIPESRDETVSGPLDWLGGALAILAFGFLTVGLTRLAETSGGTVSTVVLLSAGAVGVMLFVRCEARAANPLMPLSLFRNRVFTSANVMTLFLYGALSGVLFLLPFDLIERRGLSATQVGLTLLPIGIIIGTLSRVAGAWADRNGPRGPLAIGSVLVAMGAAGLAFGVIDFWIGVMAPVVLMSVGIALVVAPLTTAVMVAAPDTQSGAASGVNNAASRLAGLFAVAIIGALASVVFFNEIGAGNIGVADLRFGTLPDAGHADRAILERAFIQAYGAAMWIAAAWGLLAALIALLFLRTGEPEMARATS